METDVKFWALQRRDAHFCQQEAAWSLIDDVVLAVVPQVTTIKTVKQLEDLVDLGDGAAWHEKWRIKLTSLFHQVSTHTTNTREIYSFISPLGLGATQQLRQRPLGSGLVCLLVSFLVGWFFSLSLFVGRRQETVTGILCVFHV